MNVDPAKWKECLQEIKNFSSPKQLSPENIVDDLPTKEVPRDKNVKVNEEIKYPDLKEEEKVDSKQEQIADKEIKRQVEEFLGDTPKPGQEVCEPII